MAAASDPSSSSTDLASKALHKRYETLLTVRTKAIKGKGAWYWSHFEPILVLNPDTNLPKAVKLKCSLCYAVFSSSNPSRTASEHLKRGTCPNFTSISIPNSPIPQNHRKRNSNSLSLVESSRYCNEFDSQNQIVAASNLGLSGGKEDLGALAMLENSVKKLRSPNSSPGVVLNKDQIDSAIELLADWLYESCGSVSLSSLEHPKFRAFLNHVGLPVMSHREFSGARLDNRFEKAKKESEAKFRDTAYFQIASHGWKRKNCCSLGSENEKLVKFALNLPNGSTVFQKTVCVGGMVSSKYAEEVLWETVMNVCGNAVQKCVGVVADKYKAKALRNLEIQNQWMVNISCQVQGFVTLIKDFSRELPLFRTVSEKCVKIANFVNSNSQVRSSFRKYRIQELEHVVGLLRAPLSKCDMSKNFGPVYAMLDDILRCARVLQMVVLEDFYKGLCVEDPVAREIAGIVQNEGFWNEVEAVYSLVKLIRGMAQEVEAERPLIGQCLPLWEEMKLKVKDWCARFSVDEGQAEKIVEKRFRKNYHPAWSAAFILDPIYLMRDTSGKYLPRFKCLTDEQERDVDKLVTRLVSREEAHVALMELMKWRTEGLDPLYAQAVQIKQRDPVTGKMKIANPQSSRLVWETCLSEFKSLGKVAVKLIFLHATSCGFTCNWSSMRWFGVHGQSRMGLEKVQKMIFIAAHTKLERRDFSSEEEKEAELFTMAAGEDDMLNESHLLGLPSLLKGLEQTRSKESCRHEEDIRWLKVILQRTRTGFAGLTNPLVLDYIQQSSKNEIRQCIFWQVEHYAIQSSSKSKHMVKAHVMEEEKEQGN